MFAPKARKTINISSAKKAAGQIPDVTEQSHNKRELQAADELNTLDRIVIDTMEVVRINWDFMAPEDFSATPFALAFVDEGLNGKHFREFCGVGEQLGKCMDNIVNEYHHAFNAAIQSFSAVVDTLTDSQNRVVDMRGDLQKCQELLECKRFDVLHLWVKAIQLKEMHRILETM